MQLRAVDKRRVSRRYDTVSDATLCRVADAFKVAIALYEDVKGEHSWKVGTADVHSSIVFRERSAPGG